MTVIEWFINNLGRVRKKIPRRNHVCVLCRNTVIKGRNAMCVDAGPMKTDYVCNFCEAGLGFEPTARQWEVVQAKYREAQTV